MAGEVVIALLCETAARPQEVSPGALTVIAGLLLIAGGLVTQRIGRR